MLSAAGPRHPSFSLMIRYHLLELASESGIPFSAGVERLQPLFPAIVLGGSLCIIMQMASGCLTLRVRHERTRHHVAIVLREMLIKRGVGLRQVDRSIDLAPWLKDRYPALSSLVVHEELLPLEDAATIGLASRLIYADEFEVEILFLILFRGGDAL